MKEIQQNKGVVSSDEWYTPEWIIRALGPFDLDPCAPLQPPFVTARVCYTMEDDGLRNVWPSDARVWLNPPYSESLLRSFVARLAAHGNGIALLKNRTDNVLFHEVIFPKAYSMLFVRKRIQFLTPDGKKGNPFFGSVLVAFGRENGEVLRCCGIEGKYVVLNPAEESMGPEDFRMEMDRLRERKRSFERQYEYDVQCLERRYMDCNRPVPVGSDVRIVDLKRNRTKEGMLIGYELIDDKVEFVVRFDTRTKRYFPVGGSQYIIEKIND